jgi:hypothetical protein
MFFKRQGCAANCRSREGFSPCSCGKAYNKRKRDQEDREQSRYAAVPRMRIIDQTRMLEEEMNRFEHLPMPEPIPGYSGYSGISGYSGYSGISGYSVLF